MLLCGEVMLLVIQYHANIVKTKSPFDISLFSKLKHAAILLLSYIVNCEYHIISHIISHIIMTPLFTWIHKNNRFKKKATFVRSGKVEMISTFQGNRHFRKVLVNKTFTHVQEQKKAMPPRHSAYIPPSVKSP